MADNQPPVTVQPLISDADANRIHRTIKNTGLPKADGIVVSIMDVRARAKAAGEQQWGAYLQYKESMLAFIIWAPASGSNAVARLTTSVLLAATMATDDCIRVLSAEALAYSIAHHRPNINYTLLAPYSSDQQSFLPVPTSIFRLDGSLFGLDKYEHCPPPARTFIRSYCGPDNWNDISGACVRFQVLDNRPSDRYVEAIMPVVGTRARPVCLANICVVVRCEGGTRTSYICYRRAFNESRREWRLSLLRI
jgi:hypothetical protein